MKVIGILLLLGGVAVAQPAPSAEALFAEGKAAYDHGDFATAVARWQASYQASNEPGLLFSLGQALRQNGQCKEALLSYRRFLALGAATGEPRSLSEEFIRGFAPLCDAPPPVVAPTPTPAPAQPRQPRVVAVASSRAPAQHHEPSGSRTERIAGITTGGAGVALLVTGIAFGVHAQSLGNEVTKACTRATPCDGSVYGPIDTSGRHDATIGRVADAFGVLALVGGVALYYFGSRAPEVTVAPVVTPHDGGAVLTWSRVW